jgi:4-amino-4-deoxy-L-arabinose transferase-like glycosyltransferase
MKAILGVFYVLLGLLSVVFGIVFAMSNTVKHDWILLPLSLTISTVGFKVLMCGLMSRSVVPKKVKEFLKIARPS